MASLSELLNPAPKSKTTTPRPEDPVIHDDLSLISNPEFAPELFQMDIAAEEDVSVKNEDGLESHIPAPPDDDRRVSLAESMFDGIDSEANVATSTMRASSEKLSKRAADRKDSRHSSKNEGQHTDRRYLCYLCNKLFTRRRSVRDHLAKIHNTKTWEPQRSLEIVVEPETGEPTETLEIQIARGGAAPIPPARSSKRDMQDTILEEDEEAEPEIERTIEVTPVKNEVSVSEVRAESVEPAAPAPVIGKKRPLMVNKRGTAKVKTATPNKRPRLVEPETRTPVRSPSIASNPRVLSSKLRKLDESPTSSRAQSTDAYDDSECDADTPGSTNDDGEVFCICRKGDNHTWMIACDGGCEEWYHGNCVSIRERDGDLIDKYVCPKCSKAGFHTTWKRMCRRKGCRKPALVFANPPSKYCSQDCGRMFLVDLIRRSEEQIRTMRHGQYIVEMEKEKKQRKRRHKEEKKKHIPGDITPLVEGSRPHTPAYSDEEKTDYETDSSLDEDMLPNRGGALRAGEVKAILEQCKTIDDWHQLGRKPATPPQDADAMDIDNAEMDLDDFELSKIASLKDSKGKWSERAAMLDAKEALLELVKKRSTAITDEVKKANPKQKDICGFDPRLAWSDQEFYQWWKERGGQQALESGKIGPPSSAEDEKMTNGHAESDDEDASGDSMPTKGGVCVKNRCQRHGSNKWQKAQLAEARFEQELVRKETEKLDQQDKEIRDRAIIRAWSKRK